LNRDLRVIFAIVKNKRLDEWQAAHHRSEFWAVVSTLPSRNLTKY